MKHKIQAYLLCAGLIFSITGQATTLQEIEFLEANKNETFSQKGHSDVPVREKRFIRLSTGKEMDISAWQIVHFIKSDCPYCHQFDPTLKQISESLNMPVFVYSFDGMGDASFPVAYPVNDDVLRTFFAEIPRATPTSFLVNVDTLVTVPLSQGAVSANSFLQRLDESFILIDRLQNEEGIIE